MKMISEYVDLIDEEVEGAKCYAEKYVEFKAKNDAFANRWKEMANAEIQHAIWIHDYAVGEIEKLRTVYVPPIEMQEIWDSSHARYVEQVAWVRQMLTM